MARMTLALVMTLAIASTVQAQEPVTEEDAWDAYEVVIDIGVLATGHKSDADERYGEAETQFNLEIDHYADYLNVVGWLNSEIEDLLADAADYYVIESDVPYQDALTELAAGTVDRVAGETAYGAQNWALAVQKYENATIHFGKAAGYFVDAEDWNQASLDASEAAHEQMDADLADLIQNATDAISAAADAQNEAADAKAQMQVDEAAVQNRRIVEELHLTIFEFIYGQHQVVTDRMAQALLTLTGTAPWKALAEVFVTVANGQYLAALNAIAAEDYYEAIFQAELSKENSEGAETRFFSAGQFFILSLWDYEEAHDLMVAIEEGE